VRTAAGLFDVSHMGEFEVSGPDAEALLDRLTPNAVSRLATGQAHYTALLTDSGTFVDDLLIYRMAAGRFLLVVNAANADKDLAWIRERAQGDATVADRSADWALLALQGPRAAGILAAVAGEAPGTLKPFRFVMESAPAGEILISRTGYTGEDGFEIYLPAALAPEWWRRLLAAGEGAGLVPAGLGARDTLRLEAALPLYGQDIDDTVTPWEAGLGFIVKMDSGPFVGREALAAQKSAGVSRRLSGFRVTGRGVARHGYPVSLEGREVARVTSGTHSPTLGQAVGMAYLPSDRREPGTALGIEIRGSEVAAEVVPLPFYRRPRG
jgi:aminomethyltransferase